MKRFLFEFTGREVGAIGVMQEFSVIVNADNEESARLTIYDTHEHITQLIVTELINK